LVVDLVVDINMQVAQAQIATLKNNAFLLTFFQIYSINQGKTLCANISETLPPQ